MILKVVDWRFRVDVDATREHTQKNSSDHCDCAYCRNYYDAMELMFPNLRSFLEEFGIDYRGPSELMPFEPTLMLACYRVHGSILQWGREALVLQGIPILPEAADENSFFLWVGELDIPWLQEEAVEDVVSPANLPEFMERMQEVWLLRHGEECIYS